MNNRKHNRHLSKPPPPRAPVNTLTNAREAAWGFVRAVQLTHFGDYGVVDPNPAVFCDLIDLIAEVWAEALTSDEATLELVESYENCTTWNDFGRDLFLAVSGHGEEFCPHARGGDLDPFLDEIAKICGTYDLKEIGSGAIYDFCLRCAVYTEEIENQ